MKQTTPGSDPVYKRLYAFPEMVEDLLRSVFPVEMLDAADWRSLGRLPAEYVGDDFRRRHGDAVWRVRLRRADGRREWLYVLVLLEFQSTTDAIMALRVMQYTAMLYHELLREGAAEPGRLPPVLPVVLYNGDAKWNAATDVRELIADAGSNVAPFQPSQRHVVLDENRASSRASIRSACCCAAKPKCGSARIRRSAFPRCCCARPIRNSSPRWAWRSCVAKPARTFSGGLFRTHTAPPLERCERPPRHGFVGAMMQPCSRARQCRVISPRGLRKCRRCALATCSAAVHGARRVRTAILTSGC